MSNLTSIILVAFLGVIGNIAYFEYQARRKTKKDLLRQRLIELLLPIYIAFRYDEIEVGKIHNTDDAPDIYPNFISDRTVRIANKIENIIQKNLYLADDELSKACLDFLDLAYSFNSDQRIEMKEDKYLDEFKNFIIKRFYNDRNEYLETKICCHLVGVPLRETPTEQKD